MKKAVAAVPFLLFILLETHLAAETTDSFSPPDLDPHLQDKKLIEALENGEIVEVADVNFDSTFGPSATPEGEASIVFGLAEASADLVWDYLKRHEEHNQVMPRMKSSEVTQRFGEGRVHACFTHKVLFSESRNCFYIQDRDQYRIQTGYLDPEASDDRLDGVNFFWIIQPYDEDRALLAFYQKMDYASTLAAIGQRLFIGPKSSVKALRGKVEQLAGLERE